MAGVFKDDKCVVMGVVFNKSDFILCDVPVPKGYPQSQTHVGIGFHDGKFYMTTSPFPNPQRNRFQIYANALIRRLSLGHLNFLYRGEDYENPCLYVENKRNLEGVPVSFKLMCDPLMEKPVDLYGFGSYCSDPDLFIEGDCFRILNRTSVRKGLEGNPKDRYETQIHLISGEINNDGFVISKKHLLFKGQDTSPCLTKYNGQYLYLYLDTNSYNDGSPCEALMLRESIDLKEWSDAKTVFLKKGDYEPWHMSVFKVDNKLFSIIACVSRGVGHRCWQMLGEFNESLTELKIYQTPLSDYQSYRGAAFVREDGEFILYNPTVRERIRGGKSVDGREIMVAHMPFDQLLKYLQEQENDER